MKKYIFTLFILAALSVQAFSAPLTVVSVGAPAINCVFNSTCSIAVSDTVTTIPLSATGARRLQSRTFAGQPGSPAQGLYAYEYRIDLSQALSTGPAECINSLKVNFGRVVNTLDYNGNGVADDVFMITSGSMGSVGVSSADRDDSGNVTFTFNPPVCTGTILAPGKSTYFFGLVSKQPSAAVSAVVSASTGTAYQVAARAPLTPPDLTAWLQAHPAVASAIKWQYTSTGSPYVPPTDINTVEWQNWSTSQKKDLNEAYLDAWEWFRQGASQVPMDPAGLTDEPVNTFSQTYLDEISAMERVSSSYMWKLYIAHVAFSLAAETTQQVPWSITAYDNDSLRYLFDSTTMAWLWSGDYLMGTYASYVPADRSGNLPHTAFAPPRWTYPFMKQAGLIGATRIETIGKVLDWMRQNLWHFMGAGTFGNYDAVWHYRGYPPLSKIVNGTIDSNYPNLGQQHWTAGCHGSVGFLNEVLRVVNIPVQPVWVCGHELPYFVSEKLYMDHGDDPYNLDVKNSAAPSLSLLIDEPTYMSWFTGDLSVNITDYQSPACANVGRRTHEVQ